jgi:predicted DNA-binding transcriptional regulator YafY
MPVNFARHEQFLRIFALLEILSTARQPIDDQSLIGQLKERLGLSRLSARTLHRDCQFLVSCGYPIDHLPIPGGRRHGWQMGKDATGGRRMPAEPLTLLELVAFIVGRDLLRTFEGTILWSGIESLRHKIEKNLPAGLLERLEAAKRVFRVEGFEPSRYAARPRLLSTLSAAITDCREIAIAVRSEAAEEPDRRRMRPVQLVIQPPQVMLLGLEVVPERADAPLLVDIERIETITPLDSTFPSATVDLQALLAAARRS